MRSRALSLILAFLVASVALPLASSTASREPGLASAPEWRIGDWWLVEIQDARLLKPVTARLVVAAVDKGDVFVGVQEGDPYLELLTYHFPFFGRVAARDLSYEVHNQPFHPLQFPLEKGNTWTTQFNDMELAAKVVAVSKQQARVEFRGIHDDLLATITYDSVAGTITDWFLAGHGTLKVKEHGRDYSCIVEYAPRHELLFVHHAMGSTVLPANVREPTAIEVDRPFERAAVVLIAGGYEGMFSSMVIPPDGERHSVSVLPHDMERWKLALVESFEPVGTWHVESIASNQGYALSEAMGFDLRAVNLQDADATDPSPDCIQTKRRVAPMVTFAGETKPGWSSTILLAAGVTGLAALWFGLRRSAIWFPPLAVLYAKIPKDRVLESRTRSDICDLLKQQPGLTTQEIRRQLSIGWGNTVHHLMILERAGMVAGTSWGHNRHWFLQNETPASGRSAISALRRDAARVVYDVIQKTPGISQEDIAKTLGVHHSTVFFHIERLMRANLVRKTRDGPRVRYYPLADSVSTPTG